MDPISLAMGFAQFVPSIIKWLSDSDSAEATAEKVVNIAKSVTKETKAEDALIALELDPALVSKLRVEMLTLEKELDSLYLKDKANARDRDIAFLDKGMHNYRADILAFLAVGGLVMCVWFIARDTNMPERATNAIMFVSGALISAVRDVYSFEFGSSRGSKEKDELLFKK